MNDEFEGVIRAIFEVRATVDGKGGLGDVVGYFYDWGEAHDVASGRGWCGSDAEIIDRYSIRINGVNYLLDSDKPIEFGSQRALIRQRALAKLTVEEREELGL